MEYGTAARHLFLLDKEIVFLNNGSFGASPRIVVQAANRWNERIEREPVIFFLDEYFKLIREAATKLGEFLGTKGDKIAFVENTTSGINTILRSLLPDLKPTDEIIISKHTYPAVKNTLKYISEITKVKVVEIDLPFPFNDETELSEPFTTACNDNTRLVIIDHIVYTTGAIMPVSELIRFFRERNIMTIIDGAHAPGQINLNLDELHPDWYVGNCHKWLFATKGCALLWASEDVQELTKPLSISLFYEEGFEKEFDWTGTRNPSSWLSVTEAIDFYQSYGEDKIINYNHNLAVSARKMLCDELGILIPSPDDSFGSLATLQMPGKWHSTHEETMIMRKLLLQDYRLEIPFINFDNKLWFRISAQIYNEIEDYEHLAFALKDIIKRHG